VATALLGTERKPFATHQTGPAWIRCLPGLQATIEGALLGTAGALALYNEAGRCLPWYATGDARV